MERPLAGGGAGPISALRPLAVLLLGLSAAGAGLASGPALEGASAEEFLREAKVLDFRTLETGVTRSRRATLSRNGISARAVWKTIDDYAPLKRFDDGGPPERGFRDSYKSEIASYEVSKLLGLDLVPPTVYRRIRGEGGSLQLWLEDVMTEADRRERGLRPPSMAAYNRQMHNVLLLRALCDDHDFQNAFNVLVAPDFRVWAVDFSRGFRMSREPLPGIKLKRFSVPVLERLRALDAKTLAEHTSRWLTKRQRERLLDRRDRILELAERLAAERGEEAVLFGAAPKLEP